MSKFKAWVDTPIISGQNQNIYDGTTFGDDNTQRSTGFKAGTAASSLWVNSGLRQANLVVAALMEATGNTTLDLSSDVDDVTDALENYFASLTVNNVSNSINGKNISDIFETDGETVKNATNAVNATNATNADNASNATIAQYASSDTSKGTIEERLTSLGFKQGSITEAGSATVNTVKRQGNYCLIEFEQSSHYIANPILPHALGNLANDFRPLVQDTPSITYRGFGVARWTQGSITGPVYCEVSVTYGLDPTQGAMVFLYFPTMGTTQPVVVDNLKFKIGYEAEPLS